MQKMITERIRSGEAVFKWVYTIPVGALKDVNEPTLNALRQQLIKEVREVARALYWVEGIIRLKTQETCLQGKKRGDLQ